MDSIVRRSNRNFLTRVTVKCKLTLQPTYFVFVYCRGRKVVIYSINYKPSVPVIGTTRTRLIFFLCFMIETFCLNKGKENSWWNELVATGLFAVILGIFLLVLNCLISKREEDDLEEYVQRQLTRSRSGHRLERDLETGCLTTRHNRRMKQTLQNTEELTMSNSNLTPATSEVVTPTASVGT